MAQGAHQSAGVRAYNGTMNKNEMNSFTDPCTLALQSDMNRLKEMIQSDLESFMCDTMLPLEECVDWVCDRFALDCTEELVDFVADCHDAFHGN